MILLFNLLGFDCGSFTKVGLHTQPRARAWPSLLSSPALDPGLGSGDPNARRGQRPSWLPLGSPPGTSAARAEQDAPTWAQCRVVKE